MNSNLEPGYCWLSGEQCFEITETFANDHELAGHVRRNGAAYPEAYKVELLLMDGTHTHVTIHESCIHEVKDRLNELWHALIERTAWEWHNRNALGIKYKTEEQVEKVKQSMIRQNVNNPPIGILGMGRWVDLVDNRAV